MNTIADAIVEFLLAIRILADNYKSKLYKHNGLIK
jgi:hypothetical protein